MIAKDALLAAHVQYELQQYAPDRLPATVQAEVTALYAWLGTRKVADLVQPQQVTDWLQRNVLERPLPPELVDFIQENLVVALELLQDDQTPIADLLPKPVFDRAVTAVGNMGDMRRQVIHEIVTSSVYSRLVAQRALPRPQDLPGDRERHGARHPRRLLAVPPRPERVQRHGAEDGEEHRQAARGVYRREHPADHRRQRGLSQPLARRGARAEGRRRAVGFARAAKPWRISPARSTSTPSPPAATCSRRLGSTCAPRPSPRTSSTPSSAASFCATASRMRARCSNKLNLGAEVAQQELLALAAPLVEQALCQRLSRSPHPRPSGAILRPVLRRRKARRGTRSGGTTAR